MFIKIASTSLDIDMKYRRFLIFIVVLFLLFGFSYSKFDDDTDTVINLPELGTIQGKVIETAWSKREVLQFVDIRYAEPPTGKYRFKV